MDVNHMCKHTQNNNNKKGDTNHINTTRKKRDSQSVPNTRREKWFSHKPRELWKIKEHIGQNG